MRTHRPIAVVVLAVVAALAVALGVGLARATRAHKRAAAPNERRVPNGGGPAPGKARQRTAPVAIVDGAAIGDEALSMRFQELLPLASYHGNLDPGRVLALRRAALDDLVLDELIFREAVAQGRRPQAATLGAELAAVKARFDDGAQFAAALAENGLTETAFLDHLARTVIVRESRAEHARQPITERDIADYYRANRRMFERPERVHLLEILIRRDPADPSSRANASARARRILAALQRGARFADLARRESEDEYRVKDGDMGFVHRGRLDATFEAAVFAATPGRFELAESVYGFQVFKVVGRKPAEQLSLPETRPIITERLERLRREQALNAWQARLLARARVEIRDPELRAVQAARLPPLSPVPGGRLRPVAPAGSAQ